ncbi:MAG TPA: hypothetical protein V6D13_05765 [Halomicronema sp.]
MRLSASKLADWQVKPPFSSLTFWGSISGNNPSSPARVPASTPASQQSGK